MTKHINIYKCSQHIKTMGKTANIALGSLVGISILVGWCTTNLKQNVIKKQETRIDSLEKQINKDSIEDDERDLNLSKLSRDSSIFYSDSLKKISDLYSKSLLENKKLSYKIKDVFYNIKKTENLENKKSQERYGSLKNEYLILGKDYEALKNDAAFLKEKNTGLEKNYNLLKEDYKKEQQKNAELISKNKDETQFNIKNQNFFKNWKSISPKFFGVSGKFISFKDNDPKKMEAFAAYESGRIIPLKKLDDFDKCSGFYLPEINFREGQLIVYAIDKDGNKSKEQILYISGDTVYTSQPKKIKK